MPQAGPFYGEKVVKTEVMFGETKETTAPLSTGSTRGFELMEGDLYDVSRLCSIFPRCLILQSSSSWYPNGT